MSGINTVSGLRNVSIDYRPQVGPDAAKGAGAQQQAPDEIAGQGDNIINTVARPQADKAKSIVRQLDTLLLNAAGKSVSADAAEKVKSVGETLVKNGVITAKESARLESLAKDASEKLAALDDFSGRKLAKALTDAEVAEIDASIATMRNAIENVRKNGLEVNGSKTEVDKSILAEVDKVLDAARTKVVYLKKWCVERSRTRFVNEVRANFSFDRLTDAAKVMREKGDKNAVITQFRRDKFDKMFE